MIRVLIAEHAEAEGPGTLCAQAQRIYSNFLWLVDLRQRALAAAGEQ